MMDFFMVSTREGKKRGVTEVYPRFIVPTKRKSSDLMIRGGDFYAVWLEDKGLWSTNEGDVLQAIDHELDAFVEKNRDRFETIKVLHMWDAQTGMIDALHKYCQKQLRDSYHQLDDKLIFSNMKATKEDYSSKSLKYPLQKGSIEAWDKIISTLYSEEERRKIEWAIGSIVSGESKNIQKFLVLYGDRGTGKSTILNVVEKLFDGYWTAFDAKSLGSANASFALEPFRGNPLVGIQQDGDLSRIEDNTRLNSLVSHETMTVNEKYTKAYANKFKCFLFMGTNKPVKITDAKSGILRRLIDVTPTGNKIPLKEYRRLTKQVDFELGAIAEHCLNVFLDDPDRYEDYIPINMLGATNDFFNFIYDAYNTLSKGDGISLMTAWNLYKDYCEEARVPYPYTKMRFQDELKNYYHEVLRRPLLPDGSRPNVYFKGFRADKFEPKNTEPKTTYNGWLHFDSAESIFDKVFEFAKAQYANEDGTPKHSWATVITTLSELDTTKLHYVQPQIVNENHIVVDFDIPDRDGNKCLEKNLEAANKWPPTYAELSKSGQGIHLHYIYTGDVSTLAVKYADRIEIKTFTGNSALRRMLTKCNKLDIATLDPAPSLPTKEVKMVSEKQVKSEARLRDLIYKQLNKETHGSTKPSIDFIKKILDDAYNSDLRYDVSDMRGLIFTFASQSTNQSRYCQQLVGTMQFKSKDCEALPAMDESEDDDGENRPIIFFDWEVMPNVNIVCYKFHKKPKVYKVINPSPTLIEELIKNRLVGFNCRAYDNHIMWAVMLGYDVEGVYKVSQQLINEHWKGFNEARGLSYADIYDFCSKKQSLKKWEIELGIHHQEFGLPWDQPVPENKWKELADYCANDVLATEAVFDDRQADFNARKILASLSGLTVNDTNRAHITKILVGNDKKPNHVYTDLATGKMTYRDGSECVIYNGPLNAFPGYEMVWGDDGKPHNMYRGTDVGFGGYVYAVEGIWNEVALLDVNSMHPASTIALNKFGDATDIYRQIRDARFAIKNHDFEAASKMLDGKLAPYLTEEGADDLQAALKLVLNSTYGIAAATFDNPLRDPRDENNIIALRGALFMRTLQDEVLARGYKVVHIKTDSIKIPNATPEIIEFVKEFGRKYGYEFDHEATYEKMCLVNHAVYIAKYITPEESEKRYGYVLSGIKKHFKKHEHPWTATGTQFQVPYVFKTLFSHEDIKFKDLCETKTVSKGSIYLDMNEKLPDVSAMEKELDNVLSKFRRGIISDLTFEEAADRLVPEIAKGHSYQFVGRVGLFCPVVDGAGGGILLRNQNDKYYAITGTKRRDGTPYRWLEAELVEKLDMADKIDRSYYDSLVDDAIEAISKYGDFLSFISDDPLAAYMNVPEGAEEVPFA
jgi:hypothetical protein